MTTNDYGSPVFAAWRADTAEWADYTDHRFVQQLADGSLPRDAFLHYLIQDYIFLIHFSRAWAFAVVKADNLSEMKTAAAIVNALVNDEMQLHIKTCQQAGISEQTLLNTREALENLAYTRFVIDAGLSGDLLDLLSALLPCVLGYGEIGARLSTRAASDTRYRDWIETYASDDYQALCRSVAALLEQAVAARLGSNPQHSPRWSALCQRFATATRLEVGFWAMGLRGQP